MRGFSTCLLVCGAFAATSSLVATAHAAPADVPLVSTFGPPPPRPFKGGLLFEGGLGAYVPTGRIKTVSSPAFSARISLGWDFVRAFGVFAGVDVAFLSTDRAPPPPEERGFLLWGFHGGVRASIGVSDRVRIPLRVELGLHQVEDNQVLSTYGFDKTRDFSLSYGVSTGVEWRAVSRHFGVALEVMARNDAALSHPSKTSALAIIPMLLIRYTL